MLIQDINRYDIDIVVCIDATGSMTPIIDKVKESALSFYQKFKEAMEDNDITVDQLRVKIIVFRDFACDDQPMEESEFFVLPEQNDAFCTYVNAIEVKGGGDVPENALEAIASAIKSQWNVNRMKRYRQWITVFTDASALPLGERADCENYPRNMPSDLDALQNLWEYGSEVDFDCTLSRRCSALTVFAPNEYPWTQMCEWSRCRVIFPEEGKDVGADFLRRALNFMMRPLG